MRVAIVSLLLFAAACANKPAEPPHGCGYKVIIVDEHGRERELKKEEQRIACPNHFVLHGVTYGLVREEPARGRLVYAPRL